MTSVLAQVDDDLTLRVPQFFCCNCGEAQEIRSVPTPLCKPRGVKLSRRFAFQLDLPYCRRCARSAKRSTVGLIQKLVIATILSVSSGVIAMVTPLASVVGSWTFFVVAIPMFAIVLAMYALQRTTGMQTSYHQPVRIVNLEHQSSGKVSALTLAFSHARYAQAFAHANKEIVSRGVLEVRGG